MLSIAKSNNNKHFVLFEHQNPPYFNGPQGLQDAPCESRIHEKIAVIFAASALAELKPYILKYPSLLLLMRFENVDCDQQEILDFEQWLYNDTTTKHWTVTNI